MFFLANLSAKYWKTKTNTTQQTKYYNIKLTPKTETGLVASYDIWPGNWDRGPIVVSELNKFVTYLPT